MLLAAPSIQRLLTYDWQVSDMAKVNPPPQLDLPKEFLASRPIRDYMRQIEVILFQLWQRVGGDTDIIEVIEKEISVISDDVVINSASLVRPQQLFNLQSQLDVASGRIETNEIDLATRPRMSDLFRANQRIDELIDELIKEIRDIAPNVELQNKALCIQVETLQQMKLLNLRTEEAFETELDEDDIK